jgi:hypothetical protein
VLAVLVQSCSLSLLQLSQTLGAIVVSVPTYASSLEGIWYRSLDSCPMYRRSTAGHPAEERCLTVPSASRIHGKGDGWFESEIALAGPQPEPLDRHIDRRASGGLDILMTTVDRNVTKVQTDIRPRNWSIHWPLWTEEQGQPESLLPGAVTNESAYAQRFLGGHD